MARPTIKRLVWSLALFLVLGNFDVLAQVVQTKSGVVEFTSSVPLHSFTGTSSTLTGQIELDTRAVDFYVDLATLKTGIGKRDKDMRTTLNVKEFPFAEFFGTFDSVLDQTSSAKQPISVTGDFELHGKSKKITVTGTIQRMGNSWKLEAEWSLLLGDYDIVPPKLLMMKVDERQAIRISATLEPVSM